MLKTSVEPNKNPYELLINKLIQFYRDNFANDFIVDQVQVFPKRFCKYGDTAIFNETLCKFLDSSLYLNMTDDLRSKLWDIVANVLKVKNIAVIFNIIGESEIRSPNVKLLHGSSSVVKYNENNIKVNWDLREVMFSRGNISEKLRLSKLNCENEVVLDMFAGIGYFTLTYLVHCKAKHLYACELNPNSVKWLKTNLSDNKIAHERVTVLQGDCAVVAPKNVAQRINLGLIPTCRQFWVTACEALSSETGGVLHIHENVDSKNISNEFLEHVQFTCNKSLNEKWYMFAVQTKDTIDNYLMNLHGTRWDVKCLHLEHVKSYGPHVDHMVLDLECRPIK